MATVVTAPGLAFAREDGSVQRSASHKRGSHLVGKELWQLVNAFRFGWKNQNPETF